MSWELIGILAGLVLVEAFIQVKLVQFTLPIFEHAPPFNVVDGTPDLIATQVEIPTTDDLTLQANLYQHDDQPARGLIVFCHEFSGERWSAMSYCRGLWDAGFDILAFDFRNQGDSDVMPGYVPLHWLTEYEVDDVLAALQFVAQHDELRWLPLGLFGISRGGGAALVAASRNSNVRRVACEGAYSTQSLLLHYSRRWATLFLSDRVLALIPGWHTWLTLTLVRLTSQIRRKCRYVSLKRDLRRLSKKPVLMITGERDTYVIPSLSLSLSKDIGEDCQMWVVPNAKHNMARTADVAEYDSRLIDFFSELSQHSITPELSTAEPVHNSPIS